MDWLRRYLHGARPVLMARREEHRRAFVSKRGSPMDGSSAREAGANPGHVRDLLGHDDFASLASYVKLAAVDLKEALVNFHPRERNVEAVFPPA